MCLFLTVRFFSAVYNPQGYRRDTSIVQPFHFRAKCVPRRCIPGGEAALRPFSLREMQHEACAPRARWIRYTKPTQFPRSLRAECCFLRQSREGGVRVILRCIVSPTGVRRIITALGKGALPTHPTSGLHSELQKQPVTPHFSQAQLSGEDTPGCTDRVSLFFRAYPCWLRAVKNNFDARCFLHGRMGGCRIFSRAHE